MCFFIYFCIVFLQIWSCIEILKNIWIFKNIQDNCHKIKYKIKLKSIVLSPYKLLFLSYTYRTGNRLRDNNMQVCIWNNKTGYNSSPTTCLHICKLFEIFHNNEKKNKFIISIWFLKNLTRSIKFKKFSKKIWSWSI